MGKSYSGFRALSLFITALSLFSIFSSSFAYAESNQKFRYPLESKDVVESFRVPKHKYGSGHRGVDFKAESGTKVYAVADGQVVFSGMVSGALHVTIDHGADIKSTYTYLSVRHVFLGQMVKRGETLGLTSGGGPFDKKSSFHFSIRVKDEYVDPIAFLNGNSTAREIRLTSIDQSDTETLNRIAEKEKGFLSGLLGIPKDLIKGTFDVLTMQATAFLKYNIETHVRLEKLFLDSVDLIRELEDLTAKGIEIAKKISIQKAKDIHENVKELKQQLKNVQEEIIEKSQKAFDILIEINDQLKAGLNEALGRGLRAAKEFIDFWGESMKFPAMLAITLAGGLVDFVESVGVMTEKTFRQYVEIDIPQLLRQTAIPGYCALNKCVKTIQLKCDPFKGFKVKKMSSIDKESQNGVLALSGIRSSGVADPQTGKISDTSSIPLEKLGYEADDIYYYSYKGVSNSFDSLDPYQNLQISAQHLDEQVKQYKKLNPNKALDLMSHSLGGAVISSWLALYYDPDNPEYPELGKVIMFAPPISGTALSTGGMEAFKSEIFSKSWDKIFKSSDMPKSDTQVLEQIKEQGQIDRLARENEITEKAEIYIIRNSTDLVVTAASKPLKGTTEIILDDAPPINWIYNSHTNVTTDSKSVATAQAILKNEAVPCENPTSAIRNIANSSLAHALVITAGDTFRETGVHVDNQNQNFENFADALSGY